MTDFQFHAGDYHFYFQFPTISNRLIIVAAFRTSEVGATLAPLHKIPDFCVLLFFIECEITIWWPRETST
jgi:hypothetical protein